MPSPSCGLFGSAYKVPPRETFMRGLNLLVIGTCETIGTNPLERDITRARVEVRTRVKAEAGGNGEVSCFVG